jgi:hypothetical protein
MIDGALESVVPGGNLLSVEPMYKKVNYRDVSVVLITTSSKLTLFFANNCESHSALFCFPPGTTERLLEVLRVIDD